MACLQNLTIEEIGYTPYLPRGSVDGGISENPVLPENPELLFESGEFHRVPLIIGTTDFEGILAGDVIFGGLGKCSRFKNQNQFSRISRYCCS